MKKGISVIAAVTLIGFGIIYGLWGIVDIDPGEKGIVIKKLGAKEERGMQDGYLGTGTTWIEPISNDVEVYDARFQQYSLSDVETQTQDGQPILVDISLEMGLDPNKIANIHENIGKGYWEQVVYPALRSAIRDLVPSELSDSIYTAAGRGKVQDRIQKRLDERLRDRGFIIVVNLRDIDFTNKSFIATLEQKAAAAQKVEIAARDAQAAVYAAEGVANKAEGDKQKVIKEAEAERERLRLEGQGQRLKQEEEAKGILAIAKANAEGTRLQVQAYGKGSTYASVKWAEYLGPNVKVYAYPTGAPGTNTLVDLNGVLKGAFSGATEGK